MITSPKPVSENHLLDEFDCGVRSLNEWLVKRARKNEVQGASRTFVVCDGTDRVVGYYCLAGGSIVNREAPGRLRRGMPDPIPVIVIGRLAVDNKYKGQGIGKGLLKDVISKAILASEYIGVRGLLVHALSESARKFYIDNGFVSSPGEPLTLLIGLR